MGQSKRSNEDNESAGMKGSSATAAGGFSGNDPGRAVAAHRGLRAAIVPHPIPLISKFGLRMGTPARLGMPH